MAVAALDAEGQTNGTSKSPDFSIEHHCSLCLVVLHTDEAWAWVSAHITGEHQFWVGKLVVEPRFLEHLLSGMTADGLVQGSP